MSLAPGQKIQTIVKDAAPPFGDTVSASQIQDNAYDDGLWVRAGATTNGHMTSGAQRAHGNPEPTPPGLTGGGMVTRRSRMTTMPDRTPTWES